VLRHAVAELEEAGDRFDAICLLQPTSPFRAAGDIDGCIELLEREGLDAVVSVLLVPPEHNPHWVYFRGGDGLLRLATGEEQPIPRRQELPPAFHRDGAVYVTRRGVLMEGNSLFGKRLGGYLMAGPGVNLDTPADWERAERLV
jgi:CMP-N-acetylneuraminic acid synthetase